ncbi:hypothetical protein [Micromonospora sp. NPDC023737]|uniref:hypothetical protein n=1 Tax=unclassified Micromonospora TaxID=2617518 RepID=UPI0033DBF89A
MSNILNAVIRSLLDEGLDDWIPIDRIIGASQEWVAERGLDFRVVASGVAAELIMDELMVPGMLGSIGFEPWSGPPEQLLRRVIAECEAVGWEPFGDGCWMANTERGDRVAREQRGEPEG